MLVRVLLPLLLLIGSLAAEVSLPLIHRDGMIAVDGNPGLLIIDSGATTSCLFPDQLEHKAYDFRRVNLTARTAAGPLRVRRVVTAANFRLGKIRYRAKDLVVLPDAGTPAIGLIGLDLLTATGARIDLAKKRLILTRRP